MRAEGSLRDAHPAESSAAAVAGVMQWKVDVKSGAVRASYSDGPYFFTHAGVRPALLERLPKSSIGELGATSTTASATPSSSVTKIPSAADTSNARVASRTTFSTGIDRGGARRGWYILDGLANTGRRGGRGAARRRPDRRPLGGAVPTAAREPLRADPVSVRPAGRRHRRGCRARASNRAYLGSTADLRALLEADSSVWRRRDLAGACPNGL